MSNNSKLCCIFNRVQYYLFFSCRPLSATDESVEREYIIDDIHIKGLQLDLYHIV